MGVWGGRPEHLETTGRGIARREREQAHCGPVLPGGQSDEVEKRHHAASTQVTVEGAVGLTASSGVSVSGR